MTPGCSHNPEVAGSNPARATSEVAGQKWFRRLLRAGSRQIFAQLLPKCRRAFPAWFLYAVRARFALVTPGSLLVILLLTAPSANAYFR